MTTYDVEPASHHCNGKVLLAVGNDRFLFSVKVQEFLIT
jgi:hypothetical protein